MDMRPGFRMHGQAVGPGLGEGLEIRIDRRNHQMDIERLFGVRPQRLHHRRTDGDVGHEMAVHHIDMDEVGAGRLDRLDFRAQPGKIGRQDRRGDLTGMRASALRDETKCRIPPPAATHADRAVPPLASSTSAGSQPDDARLVAVMRVGKVPQMMALPIRASSIKPRQHRLVPAPRGADA